MPVLGGPANESAEDGWNRWGRLVLHELQRLNDWLAKLDVSIDEIHRKELADIRSDIRLLQWRAGMFGAIAGSLGAAICTALVQWIVRSASH